jgi:hypothetical protein
MWRSAAGRAAVQKITSMAGSDLARPPAPPTHSEAQPMNSAQHGPPSASQEMPCIFCNRKFRTVLTAARHSFYALYVNNSSGDTNRGMNCISYIGCISYISYQLYHLYRLYQLYQLYWLYRLYRLYQLIGLSAV